MKPDRFDIAIAFAAAASIAGALYVGLAPASGPEAAAAVSAAARAGAVRPAADSVLKVATARALFDSGQIKEAAAALEAVTASDPGASDAHALLGESYSRLLDYPKAVREFRMALSLDADYIDKKSPKFIGKRIKAALREAKPQFLAAKAANPSDAAANSALQDTGYLERMLAGGCN